MAKANVIEFKLVGKENVSGAFDRAGSSMKKVAAVAAAVTAAVTAVAVATTAAAVGAYKFANAHAAAEDMVGKFAVRLGTTSDVLSKFHAAAVLGGQSTRQMEMAIQRFNRRIGDSLKGLGEATKHFDNLGLSALELANMPLEDRMYVFADALAAVENPAQRLSFAFGLLESEGAGFLQTIKNGSQSLKDVAKDLEFLGGVISPQAAANAAAYTQEMGRFHMAVNGLGRAIADELIPYLTQSTKETANWMATSREWVQKFTKGVIINISAAYFFIRNTFNTIGDIIEGVFNWDELLKNTINHFNQFLVALYNTVSKNMQIISAFIYHIFKTAFDKVFAVGSWVFDNLMALWNFDFDASRGILDLLEHLQLLNNRGLRNLDKSLEEIQLSFKDTGKAGIEDFTSPLASGLELAFNQANALYEALNRTNQAAKEVVGGVVAPPLADDDKEEKEKATGSNSLEVQAEQYATFYDAISGYAEAFSDRVGNIYAQLGAETFSLLMGTANAAGQAFANVVTGAQSLGDSLSNFFKQTLTQGIAMLVRVGIQRLILNTLSLAATESESIVNTVAGLKAVYLNSFASAAAIPIYGWAIANQVALANLGAATLGVASAGGTGAALAAGAAHGGLDYVPQESTYLLNKGERVLSPRQNEELVSFMREQPAGANIIINKIEVLPNATSAKALLEMDPRDLERVVADKLYDAFERLANQGIKMRGVR